MRLAPALLVLALLAGCSSPAPDPASDVPAGEGPAAAAPDADPPRASAATFADPARFPFTVAEGREPWHPTQPGSGTLAFQVLGYCKNDQTQEVFDWMFHLSQRLDAKPVPKAAAALRAEASWTEADYVGDTLLFVARAPGADYQVLAELHAGVPADVPVAPAASGGGWDFWLCTKQATPDVEPRARPTAPFLGEVEVSLLALA